MSEDNTEEELQRMFLESLQQQGVTDANIQDFLTAILSNDSSHSGPPPAAPYIVQELDETTVDENDLKRNLSCGVCGDAFKVGDNIKRLPCKHWFHIDECLLPWLKLHNTCPYCRYELPTLNFDYDERKREQQRREGRDRTQKKSFSDTMYI